MISTEQCARLAIAARRSIKSDADGTKAVAFHLTLRRSEGGEIANVVRLPSPDARGAQDSRSMLGTNGQFQFTISGVTPGKTNVIQTCLNPPNWSSISTNVAVSNSLQVIDAAATNFNRRLYRTFEIR